MGERTFDYPGEMSPISPKLETCAFIVRDEWGRYADNCRQPPAHPALWRFAERTARIQLCDEHAAELCGDERLTPMR